MSYYIHTNLFSPPLDEKNRITAAGGFVDFGRVNGNLALSRAIGDFEFKKSAELPPEQQIVTAFPDVEEHELTEEDEFLVLACDGELFSIGYANVSPPPVPQTRSYLRKSRRYLGLPILTGCCRVR